MCWASCAGTQEDYLLEDCAFLLRDRPLAPPGRKGDGTVRNCVRRARGWWVPCGCSSHRWCTTGRRLTIGALSIKRWRVSNVGYRGVKLRLTAHGAMRGI